MITVVVVDAVDVTRSMNEIEADVIREVCRRRGWVMLRVARELGIGRSSLYRKIKQYGIEIEDTSWRAKPPQRRPRPA